MERLNKEGNSILGCIFLDLCGSDYCQTGEDPCRWDWCIIPEWFPGRET